MSDHPKGVTSNCLGARKAEGYYNTGTLLWANFMGNKGASFDHEFAFDAKFLAYVPALKGRELKDE